MSDAAIPPAAPPRPTLTELFFAFCQMSLSGFGGVLPWARRELVERRHWMTAAEFNEAFALAQFLPGPNIVNMSVVFGSRMGGIPGALLALTGLLGPPLVIVVTLAALYAHFGDTEALRRALAGMAAAAAGLIIATVAKMAAPVLRRDFGPLVAIAAFVAIGIMRWPIWWVLAVLAPLSVALAWPRR